MDVSFRRLVDDDLPLLHRWLNDPGVVTWWEGEDVSAEAVARDYGSTSDPYVEHWVAVVDGHNAGWIQCYPTVEEPEENEPMWALGVDRTAAGIDYLIGEPSDRGRGMGPAMIRAFVSTVVFGRHPHWTQVCAAPLAANTRSWRALEKAGFRFVGTIDDDLGPCRAMVLDRPAAGDDGGTTIDLTRGRASEAARQVLAERGAEAIAHPGGTLLAHLIRTEERLRAWGVADDLALAGLCHAAYGTDGFPQALFDRSDRSVLAQLIGTEAEAIVHLYGSCDRQVLHPQIGVVDRPRSRDRFTDTTRELTDDEVRAFVALTVANEVDIAVAGPPGAAEDWTTMAELFRRWEPLMPLAAVDDYRSALTPATPELRT